MRKPLIQLIKTAIRGALIGAALGYLSGVILEIVEWKQSGHSIDWMPAHVHDILIASYYCSLGYVVLFFLSPPKERSGTDTKAP